MYYLINEHSRSYAREDSVGEHDKKTTETLSRAMSFEIYGEAVDYLQNFGPEWSIVEF